MPAPIKDGGVFIPESDAVSTPANMFSRFFSFIAQVTTIINAAVMISCFLYKWHHVLVHVVTGHVLLVDVCYLLPAGLDEFAFRQPSIARQRHRLIVSTRRHWAP